MNSLVVNGVFKKFVRGSFVACFLAPAFSAEALAQKPKGGCDVVVCSLQGFNKEGHEGRVPEQLMNEIRSQLSSLPFKSYGLKDQKEASVSYGKRVSVPVRGRAGKSYHVNVTPNKSAGGRVDLTLEWRDGSGADLLSTKMRVVNGKTVLLGSGSGAESSIIGVRLNCH